MYLLNTIIIKLCDIVYKISEQRYSLKAKHKQTTFPPHLIGVTEHLGVYEKINFILLYEFFVTMKSIYLCSQANSNQTCLKELCEKECKPCPKYL